MKKLINAIVQWAYKWARSAGILVLVMCMVGCGLNEQHDNNVKVWGAGNLIVKGPIDMSEIYQIEIDGCQYLYAKWGNGAWVTHKGNCKAHTTDTVYIPVPSESHSQIK